MSTKAAADSAATNAEWTVVYHAPGKLKGRGEFFRLMLEDKGVPFVNTADDCYGADGMMDVFRGSLEAIDADLPGRHGSEACGKFSFPCLYPPAIWHRPPNSNEEPVLVNQVGAGMIYLGERLGYAPQSPAERARANAILLNAQDYIAEGRASFHPVKNHASYKDQKEEGDKVSKEFTTNRMKVFLHHFNKVVQQPSKRGAATSKKPVAGGPDVTYADFALFHVLDATVNQFNTPFYDMAWDATNVPALKEYYEWIKARPNLQSYFASDRCSPWAGDSMM